jgi:hypothetical protein
VACLEGVAAADDFFLKNCESRTIPVLQIEVSWSIAGTFPEGERH